MKITEQEIERGGNNVKRVLFSIGFEEIQLLHALLVAAKSTYPEITPEDHQRKQRIKQMIISMGEYLGLKQPRRPKSSDFSCPYCPRMLRGEKAVESHVRDVHSKK